VKLSCAKQDLNSLLHGGSQFKIEKEECCQDFVLPDKFQIRCPRATTQHYWNCSLCELWYAESPSWGQEFFVTMCTWMICTIWSCSFHTGSRGIVFFFSDFCKIPKEFGLWTFCCQYNNVYVLSVQCVFRHVHSVTAVVQPFDDFLISLNTGRPPHGRVVLAAHRDHRHRGVSASAADDPARAGERWRGVRPEPSQLLALIRFRRQLRDWPEERAAAPSGLERGHVRLHAVHAARLAWAANAAGHRRPASQLRSREHRRLEDRITRWLICKFLSSLYSTCYLLVLSQFKHVRYSMFAPIAQVWFCTSEFVMQRDQ